MELEARIILEERGLSPPCDKALFVTHGDTRTPHAQSINWYCDCHGWYFKEPV